ncbi:MAG: pitrilysin family protein [Candidatus Zixiibacteriota bacterium]
MKKYYILLSVLLMATLFLINSCGRRADTLTIGNDGYGTVTLANGIKVLVNQDKTTSLTSARILFGGGVLTETPENNGITNMMIKMLLKGNATMTAEQITEQLDFYGANISADGYRDYETISFTSLTENFDSVFKIVTECIVSPTFPESELAKLKVEIEGNIKASNDNQSAASSKLFWKTAYGNQNYGLPTDGTIESIQNITVAQIKSQYDKYIGGSNAIFAISTDLDVNDINNRVIPFLDKIKPTAEKVTPPTKELQSNHEGLIVFDRNQSFIFKGFILEHLSPKEFACVHLLNEVMGANVGSRLWYLRQKEKLAYSVYTQYATDKFGSLFRAGIGTDTSKVTQALSSLEREFKLLIDSGITETELTDARINMKNNLMFRIDRKSNRANNMAYYEYIGYNYRIILDLIAMADKITLKEVNDFVKKNFTEDKKYTSIVGKK